ncbi:hypothetical protein AVEN_71777-1 [Araneus ventricosus]|uniref:Uncharacterized protein n=1 Tax=Araneus ventricosus TaxID=182803 RepID=A0A4Y2CHU1_ARAVE|nr:hypothetical protein AVEN_71777-1 [Araneus ventricosus]
MLSCFNLLVKTGGEQNRLFLQFPSLSFCAIPAGRHLTPKDSKCTRIAYTAVFRWNRVSNLEFSSPVADTSPPGHPVLVLWLERDIYIDFMDTGRKWKPSTPDQGGKLGDDFGDKVWNPENSRIFYPILKSNSPNGDRIPISIRSEDIQNALDDSM